MWEFIEVVDTGRDANVNGREVYWMRGTFTDGSETRCITTYFYDNPPTTQQRIDRRDKILAELNTPLPEQDLIEEFINILREKIYRARAAGYTRQQIINAIINRLEELV